MNGEGYPGSSVPEVAKSIGLTECDYRNLAENTGISDAEDLAAKTRILSEFMPPQCHECPHLDLVVNTMIEGNIESESIVNHLISSDYYACNGPVSLPPGDPDPYFECPSDLIVNVINSL